MKKDDLELLQELLIEFQKFSRPGDLLTRALGLVRDNVVNAIDICNNRFSGTF